MGVHFKSAFSILASVSLIFGSLHFLSTESRASVSPSQGKNRTELKESDQQDCDFYFKKMKGCGTLSWVVPPKKVEMITEKDQAEFNLVICPQKSLIENQGSSKIHSSKKIDLRAFFDRLHVRLWMPSMGHGSRPTQVRLLSSEGECLKFNVSQLYFSMPGDWEIQAEIQKGQKVLDQARYAYDL